MSLFSRSSSGEPPARVIICAFVFEADSARSIIIGNFSAKTGTALLTQPQRELLTEARTRLAAVDPWRDDLIEAALEEVRERLGASRAKLFTPVRLAVAGRVSPPLHSTLALLPREEALARIDRAL